MARLIDGLRMAGHEVHIIAAAWDAGASSGVTLHRVPAVTIFSWLRALTFALNCRWLLARERFDLVFSLERTLRQDIYRAGDGCHRRWLVQKKLGKGAFSSWATSLNPLHWTYLYLERRLFTDPALGGVIANSLFVKQDVVTMYGVPPEKVHVVRNGLEPLAFDHTRRDECRQQLASEFGLSKELRLLYVGSGFERKGVPALVRAVAHLSIPFRLFVVGKGDIARYRRMADRLGVGDRIVFTGPVRDVSRFYLGCDVFVFPTVYDPFSNATLEAMAAGLPVVTTPFNGVSELIQDGRNGYVVADPLDDRAIAMTIERLAPLDSRLSIADASFRTACEFTMDRNIRETLDVVAAVKPLQH